MGKIPAGWQNYMVRYNQKNLRWKMFFKDKFRNINLLLNMNESGGLEKQCFEIDWNSHLGIANHKMRICTQMINRKKISDLSYKGTEIMKWMIIED